MHNSIKFNNQKIENLKEAKLIFFRAIEKFLKNNPEMSTEIEELKRELEKIYLTKKANYVLENKIQVLNQYLENAFHFALSKDNELGKGSSSLYYLKHSKRFTLSE